MIKRYILLLLNLFLFFTHTSKILAQTPNNDEFKKLASLPLQSPQAASLSKYVEFPVSYYNGLSQISLPIYEIKSGDISVPISLSYHGGGIKVQEEASWVGLGWSLNAGGVISHDIKGEDDDYSVNHPFNQVYPDANKNNYAGEYAFAQSRTSCATIYDQAPSAYACNNLYTVLNGGNSVDGEPDIYGYNFGNYSGKFFSGNGQFVDLSHNNIQFLQQAGTSFTALTPDGFTYTFSAVEKSWAYPTPHVTYTAYYLTQIKSPKGRVVTFQYKSFKAMIDEHDQAGQVVWSNQYPNLGYAWGNDGTVMQLPALSENYLAYQYLQGNLSGSQAAVGVPDKPGLNQTYYSTTSTNLFLDKIIFDNGYINFVKSPRNDLYGVKLDAINIYTSANLLVKSVPFSYSYFTSNMGDDDLYDHNKVKNVGVYNANIDYYPSGYRYNRLKLLNVLIEANAHSFDYYEGDQYSTLPYKTSFNQDFWGYYNGRKGNNSLVPDYALTSTQVSLPVQLSGWQGANRIPDDNFIRAGSLKRINYPTGGYADFSYEMNQFDNLSAQQQTTYRQATYGGYDAGGIGAQKFYFTVTSQVQCNITGGLYCNGMQDMNASTYNCGCRFCSGGTPDALYAMIEQVDPATHNLITHYSNWEFDISKDAVKNAGGSINMPNQSLPAGTYCITVNYPDQHNPPGDLTNNRRAELYMSFYEPVAGQTNSIGLGGGLRVKSIKQLDPVRLEILERKFSYTGGKIMRYPAFNSDVKKQFSYEQSNPDGSTTVYTADYRFYYLYSTPPFPYSFSANGSPVGYDVVTETITGPSSIGRTQYEYNNRPDKQTIQPDVYLPGVPSCGYLDNGFLKRIAVFDANNILVKETLNNLAIGVAATYWPFKSRLYKAMSQTTNISPNDFNQYLQMSFYPMQVGKLLTSKTTDNDYANGNSMTTVKDFSYNGNGLLSQQQVTSSDGSVVTTSYSYASDYTSVSSGWVQDLRNQNMIGMPLEVYNKRDGLVTSGSFTTYLKHDNIITPYQIYKIETSFPKGILSTVPDAAIPSDLKLSSTLTFDANGSLIQVKAENDTYTSYLWGYNKAYPVAQVTGADYSAINTLITNGNVSQSVLDNPASSETQIKQQLANLRIGLTGTRALLTTYTYSLLVGMASQTDAKGLTTSFSYDSYNRVTNIKDQQGNIIKKYDYSYSPTLKNVTSSLYYNQAISQDFSASCSPDAYGRTQIGATVPYNVAAGRYVALTQTDADAKAQAEIDANGQANANKSVGNCYIYAGPLDLTTVVNGTNTNVTVNYKCPFDVDYLLLFIKDVATGTLINKGPYSLSKAQTNYTTTVTKGKQYSFWLQAGSQAYSNPLISQTINMNLP